MLVTILVSLTADVAVLSVTPIAFTMSLASLSAHIVLPARTLIILIRVSFLNADTKDVMTMLTI